MHDRCFYNSDPPNDPVLPVPLCSQSYLIPNELPSITEGNDKNMDQGFTGRGSPQLWQPTASA
jgi:hypothetical protein